MDKIEVKAYAKINLFLEVRQRLDNGYHLLDSIMQSISLHDDVLIEKTDSGDIELMSNDDELPDGEGNLAYKAAKLFFEHFNVKHDGITIRLHKRIPVSAGLAGGSADAAAVLEGLNELFDLGADVDTLCRLGAKLGADVPFCIKRGTCHARGIGEILQRISKMPECTVLVAIGDEKICTAEAFAKLDGIRDREAVEIDPMLSSLTSGKIEEICRHMYNAFQSVSPHREEIKEIMARYCIEKPLMSGSGPSIFSIYTDEDRAKAAYDVLLDKGYRAYLCKPV